MYVRAIDDALDWGLQLQRERDLLRDALSEALVLIDPEDPVFNDLANLWIMTDPDEDHAAELEERHRAMLEVA